MRRPIETMLRPRGPYSLRLSTLLAADSTRTVSDGVVTAAFGSCEHPERAQAWQRPDGTVVVRATSTAAVEQLRFVLALDDDHSDFLRRFAADPLLGRATRELRGLRPTRVATVTGALLRALCGQLITSRGARALERAVVTAATPRVDGLHLPPTRADLGRFAPAELRELGLHARRAATLARICRELDLERLRAVPTSVVLERLLRERGLGPWSLGVVCLQGLGRYEHGLVGDLGLIKLAAALHGRRADPADTEDLLEPYGEWAGLASVYLLSAWTRGLLPVREQRGGRRLDSAHGGAAQGRDPWHREDRGVPPRGPAQRALAGS